MGDKLGSQAERGEFVKRIKSQKPSSETLEEPFRQQLGSPGGSSREQEEASEQPQEAGHW